MCMNEVWTTPHYSSLNLSLESLEIVNFICVIEYRNQVSFHAIFTNVKILESNNR